MKKTNFELSRYRVITAVILAIGLTMTGCPDPDPDPSPAPDPGPSTGPLSLSEDIWRHGELTAAKPTLQYTFFVKFSDYYYLWWNDSGQGDGLKTGDIKVSAKFEDGEEITLSNSDSAWNNPQQIRWTDSSTSNVGKSKRVIITVEPKDEDSYGTFGIVYTHSESYVYSPNRPGGAWGAAPNATPLTENTWASGTIPNTSVTHWYSLNITNEATYRFWWSERNYPSGGIFTGDVVVTGYYSDGTVAFAQADTAWTTAKSFSSTKSGKLYVCVALYSASYSGSYGIVYSASYTRPEITLDSLDAVQLTADTWKYGEITSSSVTDWYKVSVTAGTTYRFWWSDNDSQSIHTGDIGVTFYKNDGTAISGFSNMDVGTTARVYTATETGTLYIAVRLYYYFSYIPGTYGIVYSESTTKPAMSLSDIIVDAAPLTVDVWKDDTIAAGGVKWYSMDVTMGGTYRLWGNDSYSGNLVKTGRVYVAAFYNDGNAAFTSSSSSWTTARQITPGENGTVYIRVTPYDSSSAGTYGIVYSAGSTRPVINYDVSGAVSLTMNEWKNDSIAAADGIKWYTVSVTSGTSYYIFFNDYGSGDGTKTGNISVNAYYSDWAQVSTSLPINYAWSSPISFTPASTGTVYIQVIPYSGSSVSPYGSYGIVCTTKNSRPLDVAGVTSPTALTEKQWAAAGITASGKWYSIAATVGSTYYFWYDTSGYGTSTMTANITITVYGTDNAFSFTQYGGNGWSPSTPPSVTAASNGTVYVFVEPYSSTSTGTFGIVYNTTNVRPLPETIISTAVEITEDTWETGTITTTNKNIWYKFPVTAGTYYVWWDDSVSGSGGLGKADVKVSAFKSDGTALFKEVDSGWNTSQTISITSNDTVYVMVEPWSSTGTGPFGIVFSTSSTRPAQ
jgi:hypothetical protein